MLVDGLGLAVLGAVFVYVTLCRRYKSNCVDLNHTELFSIDVVKLPIKQYTLDYCSSVFIGQKYASFHRLQCTFSIVSGVQMIFRFAALPHYATVPQLSCDHEQIPNRKSSIIFHFTRTTPRIHYFFLLTGYKKKIN